MNHCQDCLSVAESHTHTHTWREGGKEKGGEGESGMVYTLRSVIMFQSWAMMSADGILAALTDMSRWSRSLPSLSRVRPMWAI